MFNDEEHRQLLRQKFGIELGEGLQTQSWRHNCAMSFRCVICHEKDDMSNASTTLFDGQEELGDLCQDCIAAGPAGVAARARRRADDLREDVNQMNALADRLERLDPGRWSVLAEQEMEREAAYPEGE